MSRPNLINRVPDAGDQQVGRGAVIFFELSDPSLVALGGGNIDATRTTITVDGVLIFDGGFLGSPWDGPGNLYDPTLDGGRTTRFGFQPDSELLESDHTYTIEVVGAVKGVGATQSFTWSFHTVDETAPVLVSAMASERRVVRVRAIEALGASALVASAWSLSVVSTSLADGLPAFLPEIVGVTEVSPDTFDLELSSDLTRRGRYRVTAGTSILDFEDNPFVEGSGDSADFVGYECEQPAARRFLIRDMVPDMNLAEDETEDLAKFLALAQEVVDLLLCDVDRWTNILDLDRAEERFLDAILASLGNPFDFELTEAEKRRLARVLVSIYKQKGTDPGIINAVRLFLGLEVDIDVPALTGNWVLGVSELGDTTILGTNDLAKKLSFYVISSVILTDEQRERITEIVLYMMRAECHFLGIIEPGPVLPPAQFWHLGVSTLGVSTQLGT